MDVTSEDSIRSAVREIMAREQRIHVLVNNAGFGIAGAIEECSDAECRAQFDTNFFGALALIREVAPHMRRAGGGRIINIGSIGGLMGLPFQGIYSATKFALMGMTEALRAELRPFGVSVSIICPGDFATGFTGKRRICAVALQESPYRDRFASALGRIERDEAGGGDPLLVARLIEKIIRTRSPKSRYMVGGLEQTLFARIAGMLPAGLINRIVAGHYGLK